MAAKTDFVEDRYSDDMKRWLMETKFINHQNPKIKEVSARISSGLTDDKSKAIAAHDWVRDNIPFGWSKSFWHDSATDVLEARVGFCDTKSTLLIALLRCMGIPARHYIVNIHRDILKGIATPRTEYLDHSYTQVYLNGRWVSTDSYIVDPKLFERAQARMDKEGIKIGYGTIKGGSMTWDGETDSFAQFLNDGRVDYLTKGEFGLYDDMKDFYMNAKDTNHGDRVTRFVFRFLNGRFNKAVERLRETEL